MTEKIKITSEQDYAIEYVVEQFGKDYTLNKTAGNYDSKWMDDKHLCLNSIKLADLARILYEPNSYEIEVEYKAGEWVVRLGVSYMGELIIGQLYTNEVGDLDVDRAERIGLSFSATEWRHATPEEIKAEKERQLWKSMGREVNEWREGDVYKHRNYLIRFEIDKTEASKQKAREVYEQGKVKGFHLAESFISFEEGSE